MQSLYLWKDILKVTAFDDIMVTAFSETVQKHIERYSILVA
jgi:hypothetical protein